MKSPPKAAGHGVHAADCDGFAARRCTSLTPSMQRETVIITGRRPLVTLAPLCAPWSHAVTNGHRRRWCGGHRRSIGSAHHRSVRRRGRPAEGRFEDCFQSCRCRTRARAHHLWRVLIGHLGLARRSAVSRLRHDARRHRARACGLGQRCGRQRIRRFRRRVRASAACFCTPALGPGTAAIILIGQCR
jgi:hypothetical protein